MKKILLLMTILSTLSVSAMDKAKLKVGPVSTKLKADDIRVRYFEPSKDFIVNMSGASKNGKKSNSFDFTLPIKGEEFTKGQTFEVFQELGDSRFDNPDNSAVSFSLAKKGKELDTVYGVVASQTVTTGIIKVKSYNAKKRVLKLNIKTVSIPVRQIQYEAGTFDQVSSEVKDMKIVSKAQVVITLPEPTN